MVDDGAGSDDVVDDDDGGVGDGDDDDDDVDDRVVRAIQVFGWRTQPLRKANIFPPSLCQIGVQGLGLGVRSGQSELGWSIHPNLRLSSLQGCRFRAWGVYG